MGADLHHVKTRKSGGTDDSHNLMPLCRSHHTECHKIGTSTFVKKYNSARLWMLSNGWEYNELLNKWRRND